MNINGTTFPKTWVLYYLIGNSDPQAKVFAFDGSMKQAIDRAKVHCATQKIQFVRVRPHICDLDEEDAYKESQNVG